MFSCDFCHAVPRCQLLQDTELVLSFLVALTPNFSRYVHSHKEMFAGFVKEITEPSTDKPRIQPTTIDIKGAILRFPGRVVTYRQATEIYT